MSDKINGNINPKLEGTQTAINLHTALSGESQAYLRYCWFESAAKKEGLIEIADIFNKTAANEKEHAEIWFKQLGGLGNDTARNLEAAAAGEHFEWSEMYDEFSQTARNEGFEYLSQLFLKVAAIEKSHEERYLAYLEALKNDELYKSDNNEQRWICTNCGHIHTGPVAPIACPVCAHSQGYFKKENSDLPE